MFCLEIGVDLIDSLSSGYEGDATRLTLRAEVVPVVRTLNSAVVSARSNANKQLAWEVSWSMRCEAGSVATAAKWCHPHDV
jgi:hypothetical protein